MPIGASGFATTPYASSEAFVSAPPTPPVSKTFFFYQAVDLWSFGEEDNAGPRK